MQTERCTYLIGAQFAFNLLPVLKHNTISRSRLNFNRPFFKVKSPAFRRVAFS
jgi:hypothetical protein